MNTNLVAIAMAEAKTALSGQNGSIEHLLRSAMRVTKGHWLVTDDTERFKAAVGAVMAHYGEGSEEYNRLKWEIGIMNRTEIMLAAAVQGMTVDVDSIVQNEEGYCPIGLYQMWQDIKGGK